MRILYPDFADEVYLKELSEKHGVPGFNYRLIKAGEALPAVAFGLRDSLARMPVEQDTIFEAASLTKPFFSCALMRMVDRGILDLDEPLAALAPEIKISADPRVDKMTARIVLSHGSGLPNWGKKPNLEFRFEPGSAFSYSGDGFYYLQRVLERISGKDFVSMCREELIEPLGMEDSDLIWSPRIAVKESRKFDRDGRMLPYRNYLDLEGGGPEPNAAWSLYSGAQDYSKFLLEIINERCGISVKNFREMTSPQRRAADGVLWGLGWGIAEEDPSLLWHWGDNGAYRSFACVDIDTGDGACIFCNSYGGAELCLELIDKLSDAEYWGDIESFIAHAED